MSSFHCREMLRRIGIDIKDSFSNLWPPIMKGNMTRMRLEMKKLSCRRMRNSASRTFPYSGHCIQIKHPTHVASADTSAWMASFEWPRMGLHTPGQSDAKHRARQLALSLDSVDVRLQPFMSEPAGNLKLIFPWSKLCIDEIVVEGPQGIKVEASSQNQSKDSSWGIEGLEAVDGLTPLAV